MELRELMEVLRHLAAYRNVNGLALAEIHYIHYYQGTDRQSALERLREAARTKAAKRTDESEFWTSVADIASQFSKR